MIGSTLILSFFLVNGVLGRAEGAILLSGFIVFVTFMVRSAAKEAGSSAAPDSRGTGQSGSGRIAADMSLVIAGLAALGFGADLLIKGAVGISGMLGVGEAFIGLTVVAVGTSIPELATSTVAALRGQSDISVGNIIGSNIFNALGILGLSSTVRPIQGDGIQGRDLLFMAGFAMLALPFMRTGFMMKRWEGGVLLVLYGAYLFVLVTS
jgi:cation:H+ antiporter